MNCAFKTEVLLQVKTAFHLFVCLLLQNLSGNRLGPQGARYFCEMLQENTTLKNINVGRNDFGDEEGKYFAETLRINFRLKVFLLNVISRKYSNILLGVYFDNKT